MNLGVAACVLLVTIGEQPPVELPRVVVEATRVYSSAEAIPATIQVIDAASIAQSGAQDVPELLEKKANVMVRRPNANPFETQIALGGFGENGFGRLKVICDGVELNNASMTPPDLGSIPLDSIARIEIMRGPSPVLYGDGAVAGVINIVTGENEAAARETSVTLRGGSQGTFGGNLRTRGNVEEAGLSYAASYDYDRSDGYRACSAYERHAVAAALGQHFENGSFLRLRTHYSIGRYQMPGALTYDEWRDNPREARKVDDNCRLWTLDVAFDGKARLAEDQWLYVEAAFQFAHRRTHWGKTDYSAAYANEYDLYAYQFAPRYVNEMPIGGFGNTFTFGFDFRYDRYAVTDDSGWNNAAYHFDRARYALFAHEEFHLTDELSAVAGVRGEAIDNRWTNYRGLADPHALDGEADFEVGLVYRPTRAVKTFVKATRYHRSAFCDEMAYTRDGRFLEPEKGVTLDAGADWQITREFRAEVDGYWSTMEDEIFYNPHAKEQGGGAWSGYNCNAPGRTRRLGVDATIAWRRDKVAEAAVRGSFVDARFASGQYADDVAPLVPTSRVRVEGGVWLCCDLEVKVGGRYVSSQVLAGDFDNAYERLPGYALFDAGLYYESAWCPGWKASFVLDNILNTNYCDFAGWSDYSGAYYYPAAGTSFIFALRYAF